MTSLLTEGLVARGHDVTLFATGDSTTTAKLHAIYPARLLARREHVAVGALRDAEPGGRGRARAPSSTSSTTRPAYYPMSLAFTRLSPTPIVADAAPFAERRGSRRCGRAIRRRRSSRSRSEQARLLDGLNVVGTVLHGIDTDSFTFRETPDDYLLFLGRFTEGKGVLQAIEIAKRVGHAADSRRGRRATTIASSRAARRRPQSSMSAKPTSTRR